jgi:putative oxidoreductase
MFALHGTAKLFGWPPMGKAAGPTPPLLSMFGIAGIIELVCGVLIAIGLLTSLAAFIASGEMAVAFFVGHVMRNGGELNPLVNKGELAVVYCFLFLYVAARGAGIWGVDGAGR